MIAVVLVLLAVVVGPELYSASRERRAVKAQKKRLTLLDSTPSASYAAVVAAADAYRASQSIDWDAVLNANPR